MGLLDRLSGGDSKSPQKQAQSLNKRAVNAMANDRLEEAEKLLLEAIRIEPNLSAAHHNLGALYASQNRLTQAMKHIRRAVQLEPKDAESRVALAKILEDMGKKEESLAEYRGACQEMPEDWRSQIGLGNALLQRDRIDEAIPHLEKAVILRSTEELTHLVLAAAYERKGELRKAIKQYEAARGTTKVERNKAVASERIRQLHLRLDREPEHTA